MNQAIRPAAKKDITFRIVGVGMVSVPLNKRPDGTLPQVRVDLSKEGASYYDGDPSSKMDIVRGLRVDIQDRIREARVQTPAVTIALFYKGRNFANWGF